MPQQTGPEDLGQIILIVLRQIFLHAVIERTELSIQLRRDFDYRLGVRPLVTLAFAPVNEEVYCQCQQQYHNNRAADLVPRQEEEQHAPAGVELVAATMEGARAEVPADAGGGEYTRQQHEARSCRRHQSPNLFMHELFTLSDIGLPEF